MFASVRLNGSSREKTCLRDSNQVRRKLACSDADASWRLDNLRVETEIICYISRQRTQEKLIVLHGCVG